MAESGERRPDQAAKLRTLADALESGALTPQEAERAKRRVLTSTMRGPKHTTRREALLLLALFAFVLSVAGVALVPATAHLSRPVVCGSRPMKIVTHTYHPYSGTTVTSGTISCVGRDGTLHTAHFVEAALFAMYFAGLYLVFGVVVPLLLRRSSKGEAHR
jgi:uncharacterized membrane protein YozB (DUF420 family)